MTHPGRIFITDTLATKDWLLPLRIVWRRKARDTYTLVDDRGTPIRRFRRWRYAYQAYLYLCQVRGQVPLDEGAAHRELHRDSWERAAREHALFKRRKREVSAAAKAKREQARAERAKRSTAFWSRFGGKPGLPTG